MLVFSQFKIWRFEKNRTEALTDGVFAIIMTLLILEIKIPHLDKQISNSWELWLALKHLLPALVSWVISFIILGIFWRNHHCIFHMAEHCDYSLVWMNVIFLLFVSFIPFPTHLMGTYPNIPLAVASLGIIMLPSTMMIALMYRYIAKNLLTEEYDKERVMKNVRLAFFTAPVIYGIAIGTAWFSTSVTFLCYAIIPFVFVLPFDKPKRYYAAIREKKSKQVLQD